MSVRLSTTESIFLAPIAKLLHQKIGVDPEIIGDRAITRAIDICYSSGSYADLNSYIKTLQTSHQALNELIEQIVIPETYFFRDRKPFEFLLQYVKENPVTQPLNILSIPCSTGEEPYSIAITLLEAGLLAHQFRIDAIDISHRAIDKAKRALYGKNSFRGEQWISLDRYFQSNSAGQEIIPSVRNLVNFKQGNLLDQFTNITAKYNIIFCRNLLIYLDSNVCNQAFETFWKLLQPDGLLFIGASETGKVNEDLFSSIRQPFTFGYQKKSSQPSQALAPKVSYPDVASPNTNTNASSTINLRTRAAPNHAPPEVPNHFILAQQLADRGEIEAAIDQCKIHLTQDSTNADVYTLLGTLHQAKSEVTQAADYFRKALYLNPSDSSALSQLALLKESLGDTDGTRILQKRLRKLS
jgi:chemotaxis protein methyltransferase WspC